ncbi:MAG: hypothetical protein ACI9EF_000710 [Pseudohongiellaceae bacterium]|jgi:hypothetical protein
MTQRVVGICHEGQRDYQRLLMALFRRGTRGALGVIGLTILCTCDSGEEAALVEFAEGDLPPIEVVIRKALPVSELRFEVRIGPGAESLLVKSRVSKTPRAEIDASIGDAIRNGGGVHLDDLPQAKRLSEESLDRLRDYPRMYLNRNGTLAIAASRTGLVGYLIDFESGHLQLLYKTGPVPRYQGPVRWSPTEDVFAVCRDYFGTKTPRKFPVELIRASDFQTLAILSPSITPSQHLCVKGLRFSEDGAVIAVLLRHSEAQGGLLAFLAEEMGHGFTKLDFFIQLHAASDGSVLSSARIVGDISDGMSSLYWPADD